VAACLDGLQVHLREHFRFEEKDGYMEAVRQRQPHRDREIAQLLEEHRQLAQSLDALRLDMRVADGLSDSLRESVRAWVERVRHHEAHENRLVQEAFNLDISAED
jgi:hypothetical protein